MLIQFDFLSFYMCDISFDLKINQQILYFQITYLRKFKFIKRKRILNLLSSLNIIHNVLHKFLFDSICLSVCRLKHYNSSNTLFVKQIEVLKEMNVCINELVGYIIIHIQVMNLIQTRKFALALRARSLNSEWIEQLDWFQKY